MRRRFALALVFVAACAKVSTRPDGGTIEDAGPGPDTPDAPVDSGVDSGLDSGSDAGTDGGTDAGNGDGGMELTHDDPLTRSGTRLRRRYFAGGPGAAFTEDFWDMELDTACSFVRAADDDLRCLPVVAGDRIFFTDRACTMPIYRAPGASERCDAGWIVDEMTRQVYRQTSTPITTDRLYENRGTWCGSSVSGTLTGWAVELLPPERFVRGDRTEESRADGMVAHFVEGEDGSRALLEVVNDARDYACVPSEGRCVPQYQTGPIDFADPGCTQPIHRIDGTEPPGVLTALEPDTPECVFRTHYYERGPAITTTAVYSSSPTGCVLDVPRYDPYYRRGPEIPLEALPLMGTVTTGIGPLTASRYVDRDGAPLGAVHGFSDPALGETCYPSMRMAGGWVCVPFAMGYIALFSDSSCSADSALGWAFCTPDEPPRVISQWALGCTTTQWWGMQVATYERGALYTGDFWALEWSGCAMRTVVPRTTTVPYELGADVSDSLIPVELLTE